MKGILRAVVEYGESISSVDGRTKEGIETMRNFTEITLTVYSLFGALDKHIKASEPIGVAIFACVKGEGHSIIKDILSLIFKAEGFKVHNFRKPATPETIANKVKESGGGILVFSATQAKTIPTIKEVLETLKKESVREKVKIMFGGRLIKNEIQMKEIKGEIEVLINDILESLKIAKKLSKTMVKDGGNSNF
ncbi:MAG: B12-binding domain-containing protein [Candidatus Wukongarchaeota archaeon]|nr:cobalamin-dependent protein [Candidatus Wukongarchaeota archaeon]MDO8128145.1 cobalamin-dependent protein [Candidatus Wukongarchaeota archaeon]